MRLSKVTKLICILMLAGSAFTACKPKYLPNTSVPDTGYNRKVVKFMQRYVAALESRSLPDLLALVSTNYSDNIGTTPATGNEEYEQLKHKLAKYFALTRDIKLTIQIQNIHEKDGRILVSYYFSQRIIVDLPSGEQSTNMSDVNRITLANITSDGEDTFEILSGL